MKMFRFPTILLSFLLCFVLQASAAPVTVDTNGFLNLPSIQVGASNYAVGFQLLSGISPVTFELSNNIVVTSETPNAQYDNGTIAITEVEYGSDKYSIELQLVPNTSPLQFELTGITVFCQGCVPVNQGGTTVSGLSFNFKENTPGYGDTIGTITFHADGTFTDDASNAQGHFLAGGTWVQTGNQLSIHFTSYQYDGESKVLYDGSTMTGQIDNNQGTLTDGNTSMNLL
ncbi:MAG: hypothetical protein HOG03_08055 [Desulfobacula sp.]|jgi:hypothetical protein|uniref:hypothetical protein n=2 Tax=Desulfobacula sp. TaxID=2593537 RepID=UPI001EB73DE5|nr:hypothetical protein [Desulfobacula sp.]MBT3804540.1 hypothetical protein [Desulfobacula sp.]MBT6749479.1 hypothetical protein [Desulfobacula sp.]MBT7089487.1 hypothetical protein [Candidatus Neomarinimicrobiota bacterium]